MTDEQIIKALQTVLDKIHNPESGIFQELNLEQKRILEQELANKRNIDIRDVRFDLSGREIFEQRLGDLISCTGMTKVFFSEFDKMMETKQNNPHHKYSVGEHTLHSLKHVRNDKVLRLTMLLHDIAKPETIQKDEEGVDHFYGHPQLGEEMARKILRRL
ncbi:MAG: HDIG domain-containing protein, partial [Alphaproteobacteria bacterium]|nr:HDIG domain-containing protein [Alphaproteobacteria bacterium]